MYLSNTLLGFVYGKLSVVTLECVTLVRVFVVIVIREVYQFLRVSKRTNAPDCWCDGDAVLTQGGVFPISVSDDVTLHQWEQPCPMMYWSRDHVTYWLRDFPPMGSNPAR